ncbi:MAG: hypothetical protein L0I24_04350 [Pseudonocardia sp.]|nr:hypothetical protein [Pseudonocardia sp.]
MISTRPRRRWTVAGLTAAAVGGLLLAAPGVAAADEPTDPYEPVTITLSPEQVERICENRIPRILARIEALTERITGDEATAGSAAWLQSRAARARSDGHTEWADRLGARAERRAGRVEQLDHLASRVHAFRTDHCPS